MTATLTRRLARLEAAPPAPPDEPEGDRPPWWWGVPVPLRRYHRALEGEAEADPRWSADPAAVVADLHERHPWLPALWWLLSMYFAPDGRPWTPGRLPTLRGVQRDLLNHGQTRLQSSLYEARGERSAAECAERAWQRHMGVSHAQGNAIWFERGGEGWVRQWRATGTRDPETLAIMGLHEPELALLDADDGTEGA